MTDNNIIDCWLFPFKPRNEQIKVLQWLSQQTAKHIILQAPVGSGKSCLALTYSNWLSSDNHGDSFVLTPQRILQEQYKTSVSNIPKIQLSSFYGRTNYKCINHSCSCEVGQLLKPKCGDACRYKKARDVAAYTNDTVMNYNLGMNMFKHTQLFGEQTRSLIVHDESHTLEDYLVEFDAVKLIDGMSNKWGVIWKKQHDISTAHIWVKNEYLPKLTKVVLESTNTFKVLSNKKRLTKDEQRKIRDHKRLTEHFEMVADLCKTPTSYVESSYVLIQDTGIITFKKIWAHSTFDSVMSATADQHLHMSSTILNYQTYCRDLGINLQDVAYYDMDSEFDIENRPIHYMPIMKMNASWKQPENKNKRSNMITAVEGLLDIHSHESGVVHTANFQVAKWLVEQLEGNIGHEIFHHNPESGDDRNDIISAFLKSKHPSILISPSVTEGLDLKDDLGRFAIITKVMFPFLGDQWIKKRMELSTEWYQRKALTSVIQGGGRVVRGTDDHGKVYILDESFGYLYTQTSHIIPDWWKKAYKTV